MHPDHLLLLHRERIHQAVAHAEHLHHVRNARRERRARGTLSRILAPVTTSLGRRRPPRWRLPARRPAPAQHQAQR